MDNFYIRWQNFHGFADTGWVEFRPLTLLLGPNNSGKTSILLPLLLMKQTIEGRGPKPDLVTRGALVNAGTFQDLVHDDNDHFIFDICYDWSNKEPGHVGHDPPGRSRYTFKCSPDGHSPQLSKYEVFDVHNRRMLLRGLTKKGSYSLSGVPRDADRQARLEGSTLPTSPTDKALRSRIRRQEPERLSFYGGRLFSRALRDIPHEDLDDTPDAMKLSDFCGEYMRIVDFAAHAVQHLLWELNYMGPLRRRPARLYELSGEPPKEVGLTGEYAPELVFRTVEHDFRKALNAWLREFEFAEEIIPEALSTSAFSLDLSLQDGPRTVNIVDVGFGLSQLLPLLVQALLTRSGHMTVATQPEIHLNPRLQGLVANLLVDTVTSGGRMAIETHSEHLLLRLRRLLAEGAFDAGHIALYFVERHGGVSSIRNVPIGDDGHIPVDKWPEGFFGDALGEALALADAQAERGQGNG